MSRKVKKSDVNKFAGFAKKYPLAALIIVVIAAALLIFQRISENTPTVTVPMDGLYVHYIDVGQGDSELVCCGGRYMLIDAGTPSAGDTVVEYRVHIKALNNGIEAAAVVGVAVRAHNIVELFYAEILYVFNHRVSGLGMPLRCGPFVLPSGGLPRLWYASKGRFQAEGAECGI